MRVVQVHWTALPAMGGVEVHTAALVAQLAAGGADVESVSGTREAASARFCRALALGETPTAADLDELIAICRRADVVHWHNPQWHKPDVAAEVSDRLAGWGGRLVFDLHNIDADEAQWRFLTKLATRYVAHSAFVAGEVRAHVPGAEVTVLPLALHEVSEPYDLPRAANQVVLQPTRLTTWKGSDLSLRSMTDLLEEGLDVAFVHAGARHLVWRSNLPEELLERVRPWQERGRIRFEHYSPAQSWTAIAAADLVVHPTADRGPHGEPFSLSVAQAIICGRPIVASDSGHLPALLTGYSAARIVPAGDQEALTGAITTALRNPVTGDRPADLELARRLSAGFSSAGARHLAHYRNEPKGL